MDGRYHLYTDGTLEEALRKGKPEIFDTDQGAQFTGEAFAGLLEQHGSGLVCMRKGDTTIISS
jgi:hypothetical protein